MKKNIFNRNHYGQINLNFLNNNIIQKYIKTDRI